MSGEAIRQQWIVLPDYLGGHLTLVLITLSLAMIISLPLGILATRHRRLEQGMLGFASVVQTIPGLALLAIMVPLLNMIGIVPALVALILYSLLPILRNTVVGIREVDDDVVEAARGIGMTRAQLLRKIQLPLAFPVIVAGLRTSAVWVVGIATLSTPVGATSLGNYIFSGLQTRNNAAILFGCLFAALLALYLDGVIHQFEKGIRMGDTKRTYGAIVGLVAIVILTLGLGLNRETRAQGAPAVVQVGNKPFTEQYILSEFLKQSLESGGEYTVQKVQNLGSTVAFDALAEDQIDLYVDYTGTLWNMHLSDQPIPQDPDTMMSRLKKYLSEQYDIRIGAVLGFENAYCLAMKEDEANRLDIENITQLSLHSHNMIMGGDVEFFGRPEWQELTESYQLNFNSTRAMDAVLMYSAVNEGKVDVIGAYTTDGRISAFNLTILADPKAVFPPYDAVVLFSPDAGSDSTLVSTVSQLEGTVDAELMRQVNMQVDVDGRSPEAAGVELYRRTLGTGE